MSIITVTMGRLGEVHFPPHGAGLPVLATGEWAVVQRVIEALAAPGRQPGSWVVPGVAGALCADEAQEIYRRFRARAAAEIAAITRPPPAPASRPDTEALLMRHLTELYRAGSQRQDSRIIGVTAVVVRAAIEAEVTERLAAGRAA